MKPRSLRAALTWTGERFVPDLRIVLAANGTIESFSEDATSSVELELPDEALLPGMINAHSHSFQRAMRGKTERFPSGRGSFWTWRESMYELVESFDEQTMYDWNLATFEEMRDAGVTTVGEFHYLHHDSAADRDHRFDSVVLDAAAAAGIRIVLLQAFYRTGAIGHPLSSAQQRFSTPSVDEFLRTLDSLGAMLRPNQSLGIVAHSIRAVPLEDLEPLAAAAVDRNLPFHMHIEEQRKEIEDCRKAYGRSPMSIILEHTPVGDRFTAVHCTHSSEEDLREWLRRGANVCITPLTEGNLGDGIQPLADLSMGQLSVGSDCNARIDLLEEVRWLEYEQRLSREDRGVFRDDAGVNGRVLFDVATIGGARSLRLPAGVIQPGMSADFLTVDLRHRALRGWTMDSLIDSIVFGGGNEIVRRTFVAGEPRDSRSITGSRDADRA